MDIFKILHGIYCKPNLRWLQDMEENDIQSVVVHKWLGMYGRNQQIVAWLDGFVYHIPPKMYCALAWSVIPKQSKAPFVKYLKPVTDDEDAPEILMQKVRDYLGLSDNDYAEAKPFLVQYVNDNKLELFKKFGIEKKHWKKHGLDFKEMRSEEKKGKRGLDLWFG